MCERSYMTYQRRLERQIQYVLKRCKHALKFQNNSFYCLKHDRWFSVSHCAECIMRGENE